MPNFHFPLRNPRARSAFTLTELVVVVTVLAILAAVGFLSYAEHTAEASKAAVRTNLRTVMSAIASEAAVEGTTPRRYVVHDPAAALTGTVFFDGAPVALSGGNWNVPGTNYTAGLPDWKSLRLNPDSFRLSSAPSAVPAASAASEAGFALAYAEHVKPVGAGVSVTVSYSQGA